MQDTLLQYRIVSILVLVYVALELCRITRHRSTGLFQSCSRGVALNPLARRNRTDTVSILVLVDVALNSPINAEEKR